MLLQGIDRRAPDVSISASSTEQADERRRATRNTSPQIWSEVERAANKGVPIIPLRIEDTHGSEAR